MGPNCLGTVGSKGCKGQFPKINGDALTTQCDRACGGTKSVGVPEYVLDVTNPDEPQPQPPQPPIPPPGAVPLKAVAVSPANGATGVFTNGLTLTWGNGGGATSYTVWLNNVLYSRQPETSFVFPSPDLLTIYWWRIDSLNENGLTTGDTWAFQTADRANPIPPLKVVNVSPADGLTNVNALAMVPLSWTNGGGALSYDVYLDGVFQANQSSLSYLVGLFTPFSVHTWRVDAVNLDGTVAGDTWSFTMGAGLPPAPTKATIVSPTDGDTTVPPGVVTLTWADGGGATSYDVYFDGVFQGNQAGTTFNTASLGAGAPHNWRIDSVNAGGTTTGDTWTFTTTYHATVVAWAAKVVSNGGAAVSATTKAALSDFCSGLDANGMGAILTVANFFVPDNLIAACTPLINPATANNPWTNINFAAGDLTVNGLAGNASNKAFDPGLKMTTVCSTNSTSVIVYVHSTPSPNSDQTLFGVDLGAPECVSNRTNAEGDMFRCWSNGARVIPGAPFSLRLGYRAGVKSASNRRDFYYATSVTAHSSIGNETTNESTAILDTRSPYIFAMNSNGTIFSYTAARLSFVGAGYSMTSAQSAIMFSLIQAARTALGGGYV